MNRKPLRIAYLCDMSPLDRTLYSGGNARIHDALQRHAGEVTILPQTWALAEPVRRLIRAMPEALNLRARWRAQYALRRVIARGIEAELQRGGYDVLFGAYALHALAGVRTPAGMVTAFTSDATQTVYRLSEVGRAHKRVFVLGPLLDKWVERRERAALAQADLLLWPSVWLKDAVAARYGVDPARNHLVPWGANIATPPPPASPTLRRDAPVRLLVIGRNWAAKGGPEAFDTMSALRAQGVDARLTVIGCQPPAMHCNAHVTIHPQLNKAVPADLTLFNAALAEAHFLVMPSFESYGFAFCEAAAHGLPSLCLRVGGVPVRDGITGHALPPGADAADFAQKILGYLDDPAAYARLSQSAREEFETQLNWDSWGQTTAGLLQEAVARKRGLGAVTAA
ncbi:glycosyltransferase family 4 protein [Antarctobacter heliothermus]|uniref:Glycosyltransferase involved in cell wall bisynthesis n=1 Tax=Antarctobacter heliothermus TaxID=74033 RepID=A0A239E365_9RHOB|nr:glycosyltransferase family 4 protein [Antarctobacter heliothermus]SNS38929.1 Glycosyltransferase involved in cell wall bisynthesis [Antarctobacter heliothermus]